MKHFGEMDRKYMESIVEEINSAESIREGMIKAYTSHLPDKERNQGELMAERAFRGVESFYKEFDEAMKDVDSWLTKSIDKLGEGKTLTERCDLYRDKIIQFTEAAKSVLPQDKADALLKAAEELYMPGQEVSEETAAGLKKLLKDLIMEDASLVQKMTETMIEYAEENEEVKLEYNETQEKGLLAAMIMAVYIAAKEGNMEEIPSDVTLDEVTVFVCSMYESSKAVQQAQEGKISWKIVKVILEIIGIVAMTKILLAATSLTFALLTLIFGTVLTSIITIVFFLTMGYWMAKHGVNLLEEGVDAFVDNVLLGVFKEAKSVISFSAEVLKKAAQTIKDILAWAVHKVAEFAVGKSEKADKSVKNTAETKPEKEMAEMEKAETLTEDEEEMFYTAENLVTE